MFHVKHHSDEIEYMCRIVSGWGEDVFKEKKRKFALYRDTLVRWNKKVHLISRGDEKRIVRKHFLESLVFLRLFDFLNKLGNVKPWVRREGRCIHVFVCSKQLYEILPKKDNPHRPEDELGFLAGLIDGDGSITKRKRKNGYSDVKMIFSQTSYLHLAKIALEIGRKYGDTSLYVIKNPYNPYSDKPEHRVNFHKKTIENLRNTALLKYCIKMNRIFLNRGIVKN